MAPKVVDNNTLITNKVKIWYRYAIKTEKKDAIFNWKYDGELFTKFSG